MRRRFIRCVLFLALVLFLLSSCDLTFLLDGSSTGGDALDATGELFEIRNNNIPYFDSEDYSYAKEKGYFIELSPFDELGRVGTCWGLFDYEHMPEEGERDFTIDTNPTGWRQKKYDTSIVPGGWLYARSHLLNYQMSGIEDVPEDLMTGTREFNGTGMLSYENMAADHLREERDHHILYRVTPDFSGNNLLAYGVLMESDCLECDDSGDFCVYVRNQQPGITIDYSTGENWLSTSNPPEEEIEIPLEEATYILNTNSDVFHSLTCSRAPEPDSENYKLTDKSREALIEGGYDPCGICKP